MLQFTKETTRNTNAAYLDTVNTASGYYDFLRIAYSQSYDESNGTFTVTVDSAPTAFRNYITFTNDTSLLPSPSGQYDVELWTYGAAQLTWIENTKVWMDEDSVWSDVEGDIALLDKLYEDRAYIEGSNESSIEQYSSPNENGTYTTYNG